MAGLVPAIHDFIEIQMLFKSWMPDIKSGMTGWIQNMVPSKIVTPQSGRFYRFTSHVVVGLPAASFPSLS
jgi:hypothetical protein